MHKELHYLLADERSAMKCGGSSSAYCFVLCKAPASTWQAQARLMLL
jgi:hypothetical protein